MMDEGYRRTKRILSDIFAAGTEDLEAIYQKIEQINSRDDKKKVRITGDVVVTNMNKVVKRVIRHKRILEEECNDG